MDPECRCTGFGSNDELAPWLAGANTSRRHHAGKTSKPYKALNASYNKRLLNVVEQSYLRHQAELDLVGCLPSSCNVRIRLKGLGDCDLILIKP